MAKELIISSNRHETKVALFEDEQLVEMYFQRADEYSLAGSIHKGRVTRVLPGMQSAFVNIGLERDAFLYVSDFFEESEEDYDKTPIPVKERSRSPRVVDEDTGEPADESNERFATAQTVASLVTEQETLEDAGEDDAGDDDADEDDESGEEEGEDEDAGEPESLSIVVPVAPPAARQGMVTARPMAASPRANAPDPRGGAPDSRGGAPDPRGGASRANAPDSRAGAPRAGAPTSRPTSADPASQRDDFGDDRRGRRRRRRRGRGGAGLPDSKFAETARPARREDDEDSRWNRKPAAAPATGSIEDDDPPQSVMIAKVSDPNRLPPPPRRGADFGAPVLPGESLAKYRRAKSPEGRSDFADRKRAEHAPEPRPESDDALGGGRYSTPRKSRHGSRPASFLSPSDESVPPSGGSEESEWDMLSEGSFASLLPPDSPKVYLAMDAEDGDDEAGDTDGAVEADASAGATKAPAKKTARKRAAKAATATTSAARKRAKATPPTDSGEAPDASAGKPARKAAARGRSKQQAEEQTTPSAFQPDHAPLFAGDDHDDSEPGFAESLNTVISEPVSDDGTEPGAAASNETAIAKGDGDELEETHRDSDEAGETDADSDGDADGEEESTDSGVDAKPAEPGTQRLSRRERRRLRMIEKRGERRRERDDRKPLDGDPVAEPAAVLSAPDGAAGETRPVSEPRADREPRADAHPARSEREERVAREREIRDRDLRDRDLRDRESRDRESRDRESRDREPREIRDSRERDSRERDSRERDGRERDGRERDGRDREQRESRDRGDRFRGKNAQTTPLISEVLKERQEVVVQIAKEPLGQKGARITSHIALPGRYVVYMPTVEHVGVSRKVGTDQERLRLRKILQTGREGMPGGFISRTAAEGRSEAEIHADMQFLNTLWQEIKSKADKSSPPALIHHDLDIVQRVLRDQLTEEFKTIWVDNEELYERILRFVQNFQPSLVSRVRLYTKPAPIFDTFNVTSELEKALRPKVWLKSGGYIVINQTEALVAIDVNTGKFVGKSNRLEDTIVKTNLEAVKEAVRQIRLRDLGGIIVVDFIDMDERRNRQKVMQALDEAMKEDRAPYKILQFNDFGLVAITRKRVKQSLERTLCQPCPYCEGAGYIKNVQTVIGEILTEAQKIAKAVEGEVSLRVNPEVGKILKSHTNNYLEELEEILKAPVIVTSDPLLHQEKFDLA